MMMRWRDDWRWDEVTSETAIGHTKRGMNRWVIPVSLPSTLRLRSARSRERLLLSLAFSRAFRSGGWSISDLAFLMWAAAWAMAALSLSPHEEKLKLFRSVSQVLLPYWQACHQRKQASTSLGDFLWQDESMQVNVGGERIEVTLISPSPLTHQLSSPMQKVWVSVKPSSLLPGQLHLRHR